MESSESFSWDTFLRVLGMCRSAADCGHPSQAVEETGLGYQTTNFEAKNSKERFSCDQLDWSSFTQKFWRCALRVALLNKAVWEVPALPIVCTLLLGREEAVVALAMAGRLLQCVAGRALVSPGTLPWPSPCCVTSLSLPGQRSRGASLAAFRAWASTVTA